jgi:ketosteroid isomerase-like protein
VTAAAVAEMPSGRQVKAESARDAVVPPGATAAGKLEGEVTAAVESFRRGLLDQQLWGDELASRSDAVFVGPTAGEVARGKQAIRRAWKARMKANVREATSGELTAALTPDEQLVWISVPVTRVADGQDPLPLRIFAVYEKVDAAWKLIALHEALALDEPGSGAAFKKIVPPEPEPVEPEAKLEVKAEAKPEVKAEAKTDAKKGATTKKPRAKKKRRPRPAP